MQAVHKGTVPSCNDFLTPECHLQCPPATFSPMDNASMSVSGRRRNPQRPPATFSPMDSASVSVSGSQRNPGKSPKKEVSYSWSSLEKA